MSLLLCGCSTFDSLDSVHASEKADAGDVGTNSDVNLDAQIGADLVAQDMRGDMLPDLTIDVSADTPIDMVADTSNDSGGIAECLTELPTPVLTSGHVCSYIPPQTGNAICDPVEQNCMPGKFCLVRLYLGTLETACVALHPTHPECDFVPHDDVCSTRANTTSPPESLGTCYPGSACPAIGPTQLTTSCARFCKLATAEGCRGSEYCIPLAPDWNELGIGRCEMDATNCSVR